MTTPTTFWRLAGVSYVQVGSINFVAVGVYEFRVIWMVLLLIFLGGRGVE